MWRVPISCLIFLPILFAGGATAGVATVGSITGSVTDSVTGRSIEKVQILAIQQNAGNPAGQPSETFTTGKDGRFRFENLAPGRYLLMAISPSRVLNKAVTLSQAAGDLNVDFAISPSATISGTVFGQNGEPVPGWVYLLTQEYRGGVLRTSPKLTTTSDENGRYRFSNVEPDRGYVVMSDPHKELLNYSREPIDPHRRHNTLVRSFYADAADLPGALMIHPKPGDEIEGIDLHLSKAPSYCIETKAVPSERFTLDPDPPISAMIPPGGRVGSSGELRLCGVGPGSYTLTTFSSDGGLPKMQRASVEITKTDALNVILNAVPDIEIHGDARWEGSPDVTFQTAPPRLYLRLEPAQRYLFPGEKPSLTTDVPSQFSSEVVADNYLVRARVAGPGFYVKSVYLNGVEVNGKEVSLGTQSGQTYFQVIVGTDGSSVNVQVLDKNGNPLSDAGVAIMPKQDAEPGQLAAHLVAGKTDQNGTSTSGTIPPGKYYVVTTGANLDVITPELLSSMIAARTTATEINLSPRQAVQLPLSLQ